MKGKFKLLFWPFLTLILTLFPASSGLGEIPKQILKSASQSESPEINDKDSCFSGPMYTEKIDACYLKLMGMYACAVQAGGDVERKAEDKLERFYRQLHNETTVGIEKIYKKAKKLGCRQKTPLPIPKVR